MFGRVSQPPQVKLKFKMPTLDRIESCADFQSLIPAYLAGKLSEARSLLLVDHTHECIPCRRAMNEARRRPSSPGQKAKRVSPCSRRHALGYRRALVIGFGLAGGSVHAAVLAVRRLGSDRQAAEGQVYQIADTKHAAVTAGAKLQRARSSHRERRARRCSSGRWLSDRNEGSLGVVPDEERARAQRFT